MQEYQEGMKSGVCRFKYTRLAYTWQGIKGGLVGRVWWWECIMSVGECWWCCGDDEGVWCVGDGEGVVVVMMMRV